MYSVLHTRRNAELFFSDILGSLHLKYPNAHIFSIKKQILKNRLTSLY
jgi:hypothetical protein